MQKGKKTISKPSPKSEAQKDYMDYYNDTSKPSKPVKQRMVKPSFLISQELNEKIDEYIFQKRTQGDIYYSKAKLLRDALYQFLGLKEK